MEQTAFQIHPEDNVATALSALGPGRVRLLGDTRTDSVTAKEEIPSGHKIALNDIARDEKIVKYGVTIGCATASALGVGNSAYDENGNLRDGGTVSTQEAAQKALDAINQAIVSKDKIRAHMGAMQNRLENTITNLTTQAENLQAAESRISDVDVATEMTEFVRNQILTQSAVAMLSQANSLPQMALQLIG